MTWRGRKRDVAIGGRGEIELFEHGKQTTAPRGRRWAGWLRATQQRLEPRPANPTLAAQATVERGERSAKVVLPIQHMAAQA